MSSILTTTTNTAGPAIDSQRKFKNDAIVQGDIVRVWPHAADEPMVGIVIETPKQTIYDFLGEENYEIFVDGSSNYFFRKEIFTLREKPVKSALWDHIKIAQVQ